MKENMKKEHRGMKIREVKEETQESRDEGNLTLSLAVKRKARFSPSRSAWLLEYLCPIPRTTLHSLHPSNPRIFHVVVFCR